MDPITHGLLGAATAQLGFRQRIGRDATWAAVAAAVLPDLDVLAAPLLALTGAEGDGLSQLRVHRGPSHSLLAVPLLALAVAAVWWRLRRHYARRMALAHPPPSHPSFGLLYLCVLAAAASHPLLDWCTSYGTQLLYPMTDHRFALDAAPIIDLAFTALTAATVVVCWLVRRIRGDVAARATLIVAWAGFLLAAGYLALGRELHDLAVRKAMPLAAGEKVLRADAYPAMGSVFLWRVVIETDRAWHVVRVHHYSTASPARWRASRVAKAPPGEWIDRARATEEYATYSWFAGGRLRAAERAVDGLHVVEFHDMRYGERPESPESFWPLVVQFGGDGRVLHAGRWRRVERGEFASRAAAMWREMWNP